MSNWSFIAYTSFNSPSKIISFFFFFIKLKLITNLFIYGLSVSILIIRSLSIAFVPFKLARLSAFGFFCSSNFGNAFEPCRITLVVELDAVCA
jgi:hypothetical protein